MQCISKWFYIALHSVVCIITKCWRSTLILSNEGFMKTNEGEKIQKNNAESAMKAEKLFLIAFTYSKMCHFMDFKRAHK